MSAVRYSSACVYLRAAVEHELAMLQRRPALVTADELVRTGLATFGADDALQAGFDALAQRAALDAWTPDRSEGRAATVAADLELDRELVAAGVPIALLTSLSDFAAANAEAIVKRTATVDTRSAQPANVTRYDGVWAPGTYARAAMVTHHGSLWHCEAERTTDPPGTSSAWKLMHKSHKKGAV